MNLFFRIDSGASKCSMLNISLFQDFEVNAANVSFITAAGTNITSRAEGTVKFKVFHGFMAWGMDTLLCLRMFIRCLSKSIT